MAGEDKKASRHFVDHVDHVDHVDQMDSKK